ncbi:MAG: sodium:solute symporter family protein [bacterium]|nr:sodium:solute symporter family protein [bacterium]
MNLQLVFLAVYLVALVALGLWIGRRVESSDTFFVAGRRLGPVLVFATVLAANIGAGSTVGAAGLGFRDGLAAWWWVGSAGIGTLLLAFWIGPRIWRLAKEHDLHTMGDFLELRYGKSVRAVIAITLWLGTLAILAGQLIALAWILDVVAGVPKPVGCLIGGLVMTIYFSAGGLLTSAWVNLVQLVVLLVGLLIALPWALSSVGGWSAIEAAAPSASADYLGFFQGGGSGWHYMVLLVPAFMISPGLVQKVYGARDERTIRIGVGASGLALMAFAAVPPLIGMIARTANPSLESHELALPWLLAEMLPPALGSLGLAAVLSAELSSADAILFMLSTSLSKDLYKRFYRPQATDAQVLKVSRWAAVAGGGLGVLLAIVLPSVIDSLKVFYAVLSVSLFVPVVAGLHFRRAGTPEALAAIGAGVAALFATPELPGIWTPNTIGLIVSALAFGIVALARARKG